MLTTAFAADLQVTFVLEEKVATEPPKQVRDEHVVKGEEDEEEEDVLTQPYDNGEGEESPQEADGDDAAKKTDAINTESEAGFIGPKARGEGEWGPFSDGYGKVTVASNGRLSYVGVANGARLSPR